MKLSTFKMLFMGAALSFSGLVSIKTLAQAQEGDEPAVPTFNGSPVFLSAHGGNRQGGTVDHTPQTPPPTVLPSGITQEQRDNDVYDPGDTLELLTAWRWTHQTNTAIFGLWEQGGYETTTIKFKLRAGVGGLGGAVALLPTDHYGHIGEAKNLPEDLQWDEPNLPGALAIAFDTHNPATANWFNEVGNIYDRPQREISVHFDGVEICNVLSPVEYRASLTDSEEVDEGFHDVAIQIDHHIGGGYITVWIDEQVVIDRQFIAELEPYEARLAFGASSSEFAAAFDIRAIAYDVKTPAIERKAPTQAMLIDDEFVHAGNRTPKLQATLPQVDPANTGRIILTLSLNPGLAGCDPWDKKGAIYLWDEQGTRYELTRFITPYGRPYQWKVDVTDYALLLQGQVQTGLYVDTWMSGPSLEETKGWRITVELSYYPGTPEREVVAIENLWVGEPEYGNPANPMDRFFTTKTVTLPPEADGALLRLSVTGHGMSPASYNAAEFMPAQRTVTIAGEHRISDMLWNEDCYLNPCRPQGGSWKFDRAGWAPGSIARIWDIDFTQYLEGKRETTLEYFPMVYTNENRAASLKSTLPTHWVESQVIYYRTPRK